MREAERRKQLGDWGEVKALELLKRSGSGFANPRDVNEETHNHPFGDLYVEIAREPFLIGVKTRNKYNDKGKLNGEYNVKKKGANVRSIGARYKADLGWIAIQVIPELQTFNAYFGTIAEIEEYGERFSIPMKPEGTEKYMRLGREDEFDSSIRPEWSNGGYARYVAKHGVRTAKKMEPTASRHSIIKQSDKASLADITSASDDVGMRAAYLGLLQVLYRKKIIISDDIEEIIADLTHLSAAYEMKTSQRASIEKLSKTLMRLRPDRSDDDDD